MKKVNGPSISNEGHAHIYIKGEKLARLYGAHFHLADLLPGSHKIEVTLNAHSHEVFSVDSSVLKAELEVLQPSP